MYIKVFIQDSGESIAKDPEVWAKQITRIKKRKSMIMVFSKVS